jgi:hypothetical protein
MTYCLGHPAIVASIGPDIPSANLCKNLHNFVDICIRKQNFAELTPVHPAPVMQANGTRCSRLAFILLAGTIHILFFRSILDDRAPKTSSDRAAVRMQNSRASTVVA